MNHIIKWDDKYRIVTLDVSSPYSGWGITKPVFQTFDEALIYANENNIAITRIRG